MTENTIVEREYYAIETRDERRQRWYRDDGEYDSVEELKEHWEELITEGVTGTFRKAPAFRHGDG